MDPIRVFSIISWILLPTVMYGGYSLLALTVRKAPWLTAERIRSFRAGHAHAGVLLILSLVYYAYLNQTTLDTTIKLLACLGLVIGILAQSGGFFLNLLPQKRAGLSAGNLVTIVGAVLLAVVVLLLAYGLIAAHV